MIHVYKFQDYDTVGISAEVLYEHTKSYMHNPWLYKYTFRKGIIIPIPKSTKILNTRANSQYASFELDEYTKKSFTFEDKVFIHPSCTIPRAKVTQKYKKVLNSSKANICIVPSLKSKMEYGQVAIFINKEYGRIYVIESNNVWRNNEYITLNIDPCLNASIGTTPLQLNPHLAKIHVDDDSYGKYAYLYNNDNWKAFINSTLIYCGYAFQTDTKQYWVGDVLYKQIHDVVTEEAILATLGDTSNVVNTEILDSIKTMLTSTDLTTVELGLKTLAELDYNKYRNTVKHLLYITRHRWALTKGVKINTNVKYMLKQLRMESATLKYDKSISKEDYQLMEDVVKQTFYKQYDNFIDYLGASLPFVKFKFNINYTVTPNISENSQEKLEEDNE